METFLYYFQWFKTNYPGATPCRRPLEGAKLIIIRKQKRPFIGSGSGMRSPTYCNHTARHSILKKA